MMAAQFTCGKHNRTDRVNHKSPAANRKCLSPVLRSAQLACVQICGNHFGGRFSSRLRDAANHAAGGGNRRRSRAAGFIAVELD
jgi:hypothetical protein